MEQYAYPVKYEITRPERYNRWTVAFRLVLAIPQLLLVGSGGIPFVLNFSNHASTQAGSSSVSNGGLLTALLGLLVFLAWFAILFTGRFPVGMRNFCLLLFRWAENVHAYVLLQAAPYPPFGEGPYPLDLQVTPAERYNRWTVFFRLFLVIPHLMILFFLSFAQLVVTVIAWFAILFTGQYPAGLFDFSVGVSRWTARVAAYLYLFVDEYPPFTLASYPDAGTVAPQPA